MYIKIGIIFFEYISNMFRTILELYLLCLLLEKSFSHEYCQVETFEPRCEFGEVIVVDKAKFGRMEMGKCLQVESGFEGMLTNPQYIGCYVDVTDTLNDKCGGENHCRVKVSDLNYINSSCYRSMVMYLEVQYKCLKVVQQTSQCMVSLSTDTVQYFISKISNKFLKNDGCGSTVRPFQIEALQGQKISVVKVDMMSNVRHDDDDNRNCGLNNIIGYVNEKIGGQNNYPICDKIEFLFTSTTSQIELYLTKISNSSILLKIEATGCSDLIPPADAWLKRTENEATIGCYSTRLRWQLKCVGQRWIGVIGNCSYAHNNVPDVIPRPSIKSRLIENNNVFLVVAICAVGIILCIIIVCFGIIFFKRYNNESKMVDNLIKDRHNFTNGSLKCNQKYLDHSYYQCYSEGETIKPSIDQTISDNNQYFVLEKNEEAANKQEI